MLVAASMACGGIRSGWPPEGDASTIRVTVENDLTERSDILVRIMSGSGVPATLGGVSPGQRRTFEFREPLIAGSYTLTASAGDGRELRSRPFTLFPEATVVWRLQHDELRVLSGSEIPTGDSADIHPTDHHVDPWPERPSDAA